MNVFSYLHASAQNFIYASLRKFFFFSYKELPQKLIQERIQILMDKEATQLTSLKEKKIEAYYIPANSHVTHTVVFTCTTHFLQLHPRNYDYLKPSANVVLWNPSQPDPCQYQKDLQSVLKKIRKLNPNNKIIVQGHCAVVDPIIAATAALKDKNIDVILDRGYGDVYKLARSMTCFSNLPIIKTVLSKYFDCKGEKKIKDIKGKVLFIDSNFDQITKWGKQNLMKELIYQRGYHKGDQVLKLLPNSDHWTRWHQATYQEVHAFIGLPKLDISLFPKSPASRSFFSQYILPRLIHTYF